MTCEPPSPPATLLPSPHPPETIFESVAPTEPCRHLHPRRWETMGARLPSPAPDRPHRPRVSLKAVPSALGVCHLWGGVGGSWGCSFPHPPKRGCCCECGFALVVVALLCRGGRVGGVRTEAAASRCRRHWSELGFLREMGSREQQASSYAALRPDAD